MRAPALVALVVLAGLAAACLGKKKVATPDGPDGPTRTRTPLLSWVFDDQLNLGDGTTPGQVHVGDQLLVQVDTGQRFGDPFVAPDAGHAASFPAPNGATIGLPVGLRDFYFAARGNGFWLDDGTCTLDAVDPNARSAAAVPCSLDPERTADVLGWPRTTTPPNRAPPYVFRCTAARGLLLTAGSTRPVRLLESLGDGTFSCAGSWTLKADDDHAIAGVVVHLKTGSKRVDLAAQLVDGQWILDTTLDVAGGASANVEVRYANGLAVTKVLPRFEVVKPDDHSLVRIQPELMSSQDMRSVNLGVAITPVARAFFDKGPWTGRWWLNGINPSAVVRFSGTDTTVLQFGVAGSFFVNRSMLFNGGILFGTPSPSTYWDWQSNLFIGFAIDPTLLLEARNTGK